MKNTARKMMARQEATPQLAFTAMLNDAKRSTRFVQRGSAARALELIAELRAGVSWTFNRSCESGSIREGGAAVPAGERRSAFHPVRSSGGARAGEIGTASDVRPRCSRVRAVTRRSVMNARTRRASPQRGHWVTSSPNTLRSSCAQSSLRASLIAVAGDAVMLPGSAAAVGSDGTTRERHAWPRITRRETGWCDFAAAGSASRADGTRWVRR